MFKKLNFMKSCVLVFIFLINYGIISISSKDLLNVSFDTTREIFSIINSEFQKENPGVFIFQSHGGSSRQAGYVMAGLRADVVCLALSGDINSITEKGFISKDWKKNKPNGSVPFQSVVTFLVKKGNPKNIKNWDDLEREDIEIITPNPKTSGGGKWNFLAIYGYALTKSNGDKKKSFNFLKKVYSRVPVMDTGSRGSAATFVKRNVGDVLLIWENEAFLALKESKENQFEIVYPKTTILTEPVISIVNRTVKLKDTEKIANKYLDFLYTEKAQRAFANNGFRPIDEKIKLEFKEKFFPVQVFKIEEIFKNWEFIQEEIFAKGKLADEVLK